ncbi:MAG: hypothetical protein M3Y20_00885 [Actinomycetota bacterium]|nr:hypothetical protein [Actinomycetota bacterium]
MDNIEPLPDGTRLVHVGPPKTATTSIQASFHASRKELKKHSVRYAGKSRHSRSAATAVAMEKLSVEFTRKALDQWEDLAREMRESDARITVLSSEGLSYADEVRGAAITEAVGGNAQVVITMRSPARMVPSVWQQRVRRGSAQTLDGWVRQVFDRDADGALTDAHYWKRFGLEELIATWSAVVGSENVTVVIVDPRDHAMAYHAFEQLLGVPRGTLTQVKAMANESFPFAELETIRTFNEAFYAAGGTRKIWLRTIRKRGFGEFKYGEEKLPGAKVEVPRWVAEAGNEVARGWIPLLEQHPGRVIGDPANLLEDPARYAEDVPVPATVPISSAGTFAHIVYDAVRQFGPPPPRTAPAILPSVSAPLPLRRRVRKALRVLRHG